MRLAWKLALAYAWRHPARMLLTSLAMVASACVVVWVVSGYDAMASQFGHKASEYLGRYDLFVVPDSVEESYVSPELIEALRKDPDIAELEPVLQATVRVQPDKPSGMGGPGIDGPPGRGGPGMGRPPSGGPSAVGNRGRGDSKSRRPQRQSTSNAVPPHPNPLPKGEGTTGGAPATSANAATRRPPRGMFGGGPKLVGVQSDHPPYALLEGRWLDYSDPKLREAVISNQSAEQLNIQLGDEVLVISGTKEYRLKIVGIVAQASSAPTIQRQSPTGRPIMSGPGATLGPATSALYVPMSLAEKITRTGRWSGIATAAPTQSSTAAPAESSNIAPARINLVNIKLRDGVGVAEFRSRWLPQVAQSTPAALLVGVKDLAGAMEEGRMAANAKKQAWAATGMSLLAALFIIFTTLSMGVNERVRQFAVMRAVGLTRFQVACVIAAESLVLALIGWGGGLVAGWGLIQIVSSAKPDLFRNGASLGTWCVILTGLSALGGALVASILPAWQAMRVQPLEAMSPRRSVRPSVKLAVVLGVVGLLLIAVNPLLVYAATIPDAMRYGIYEAIGCTCMAIGFLLLTPLMIMLTETVFGPWVARLAHVEPRLLTAQLSTNLWRTVGTTVALTVGLGLYVAMMVWGYSMLQPFRPGDWVPDMLVALQLGGLPDSEIDAVRQIEGVIPEQCIPLAVDQPRLAADITGSREGSSVTRQDNVIMIGLDPQVAFGGAKPLIGAEFVAGSRADAVAKLKQGRYCIVPDHFLAATGLKIGDQFGMIPPERPDKPVEYTIAGAVSLPGWHWMTKFSGLRRRSGRSAAMVFAAYDEVRRDFDLKQTNFFWMNVDPKFGEEHLAEVIKAEEERKTAAGADAKLRGMPMPTDLAVDAKRAAVVKIAEALRPLADQYMGERQPVNGQGTMPMGATMFGPSLRITTPDEIRVRILGRADSWIWAMCWIPLITLLVTSLGVINTIMASVRARRWEFGVLRALGLTRSGLFRMILVEGLLIGLVACLLSLGFGIMAGWCGTGISQYVSFFGGMATPLIIPWAKLSLGLGAALALCLVAALWPAIMVGRTEPLELLQAGRSAM